MKPSARRARAKIKARSEETRFARWCYRNPQWTWILDELDAISLQPGYVLVHKDGNMITLDLGGND